MFSNNKSSEAQENKHKTLKIEFFVQTISMCLTVLSLHTLYRTYSYIKLVVQNIKG